MAAVDLLPAQALERMRGGAVVAVVNERIPRQYRVEGGFVQFRMRHAGAWSKWIAFGSYELFETGNVNRRYQVAESGTT